MKKMKFLKKLPGIPHKDWCMDFCIEDLRHIQCELSLDPYDKWKIHRKLNGQVANLLCVGQAHFRIY